MERASATQARERRVVLTGSVVVIVALALVWVVLPFTREWSRRERAIAALRVDVDSLAGLVAARAALERTAASHETTLASRGRRVFHARSLALAASALQALLTDAADAAHLVVTRLDVADAPEAIDAPNAADAPAALTDSTTVASAASTQSLPATLSFYCDVIGLAALLDQLERAPRVVHVERLTVQQNPALRGAADMLQVTLTLSAPVIVE